MVDVATVRFHNRAGHVRTVDELTTLFDLCLVVVDGLRPGQLRDLKPVIERLHRTLSGADCTVGLLAVGVSTDEAIILAGPLWEAVAVFADPDATATAALGLTGAPGLIWVDTQPAVRAVVAGWDGNAWRPVLADLAWKLAWTRPLVPVPGDPAPIDAHTFTVTAAAAPKCPGASRPAADGTR
ncbi:MAG TPA: hypothetical protein VFA83_13050 [Acidimicrobiales bacterium]|nr:hypothetical protein [Acidimicrobiales bacterium]